MDKQRKTVDLTAKLTNVIMMAVFLFVALMALSIGLYFYFVVLGGVGFAVGIAMFVLAGLLFASGELMFFTNLGKLKMNEG